MYYTLQKLKEITFFFFCWLSQSAIYLLVLGSHFIYDKRNLMFFYMVLLTLGSVKKKIALIKETLTSTSKVLINDFSWNFGSISEGVIFCFVESFSISCKSRDWLCYPWDEMRWFGKPSSHYVCIHMDVWCMQGPCMNVSVFLCMRVANAAFECLKWTPVSDL
jgi:hypothetical protein